MPKISHLRSTHDIKNPNNAVLALSPLMKMGYRKVCTLAFSSALLIGLTACGQKGELYLVDPSSQTVTSSSEVLESTSNPQDAAFADIDDNDYQKTRYLEQKQILPEASDDPNDY